MDIVHPNIIRYMRNLVKTNDPIMEEMQSYSIEHRIPRIGTLGGQLCMQMAKMINAKAVFELGSTFGYSTLHFTRGMGEDGVVHFTHTDKDLLAIAKSFLEKAQVLDKVSFHEGDPLNTLKETNEEFDIILINQTSTRYKDIMPVANERLRVGGVMMIVNSFHQGSTVKQSDKTTVQASQIFNHTLFHNPNYITTINPIRGGITIALKTG